jgi:C4-dicarboxylate-binding protein DctP
MYSIKNFFSSFRSVRIHMLRVSTATCFVACNLFTTSQAQTPIVIRFSHVVAPETAKGKAAQRFKELAESRTMGRVRVEVSPNSELYRDREELEALQLGAVQMLAPSLSKLATLGGSDFEAFDLPFIFKSRAAFRAVADAPIGAALLKRLEDKGITGLAYWDNGFKAFTANRQLRNVADFKDLRVRVQSSGVIAAQMRALDAEPIVTPLSDVYLAIKEGLVDGQESAPSNIYTQKLHEVQSHLTASDHAYLAYAVVVNKPFWDGLPRELRTILEGAMRDATAYEHKAAEAESALALDRIRGSGKTTVHKLTPDETAQWRKALRRVYVDVRARISPQTLSAMQTAAGFSP